MNAKPFEPMTGKENISLIERLARFGTGIFIIVFFMHNPPENIELLAYIDMLSIGLVLTSIIGIDPVYALASIILKKRGKNPSLPMRNTQPIQSV